MTGNGDRQRIRSDVYKRQRNGEKVSETFDIKYEILNAPAGNHAHVYPVSYTHLDVYKRQALSICP